MPSLWGLLTGRGRLVGATGVALGLTGWWLHEPELLWLAAALLALLAGAVAVLLLARPRETVVRQIRRPMVTVGEQVDVELSVRRRLAWLHAVRIYEDEAPAELGTGPRFRLPSLGGPDTAEIAYTLPALRRGRYNIGPLAVDIRDPFGLARIDYAHGRSNGVLVAPRVDAIPRDLLTGQGSHRGGDAPQRMGATGDDDILVREYRHGDSMRRVHWRSSAKAGDLMVRREEQTYEHAATVVLDTRYAPHAGDAADDSFEWAVQAATSLGVHLIEAGRQTEVLGPRGLIFRTRQHNFLFLDGSHLFTIMDPIPKETLS